MHRNCLCSWQWYNYYASLTETQKNKDMLSFLVLNVQKCQTETYRQFWPSHSDPPASRTTATHNVAELMCTEKICRGVPCKKRGMLENSSSKLQLWIHKCHHVLLDRALKHTGTFQSLRNHQMITGLHILAQLHSVDLLRRPSELTTYFSKPSGKTAQFFFFFSEGQTM